MKQHHLHLKETPFKLIQSGRKKIEIRLFDEKRQLISLKDTILFENNELGTVKTGVVGLHWFSKFSDLLEFYDESLFGDNKGDILERLYGYYSKEDEQRYGVLAIYLG